MQIASLPLLALSLWQIRSRLWDRVISGSLLLAGAILLLPLLQLLPLPPALWTSLPGRGPIADAFIAVGAPIPWFPTSLSPAETWRSALGLLPPLAMFLLVLNLGRSDRRVLSLVLIGCGLLSVFIGLAQAAGGTEGPFRFYGPSNASVGFFINRNHYAALLYSIVPFTAAWAAGLAADRRPEMTVGLVLSLLVFVALIVGLAIARSRAGFVLAMIAGGASIIIAGTSNRDRSQSRRGGSSVRARNFILVASGVAALIVLQFAAIGLMQDFEVDPVEDERWAIAKVTVRAALDFLPFGSGFGTFDSVYKMYESVDMLSRRYVNNAHNDFAEVFLEGGLLAVAIFVAFGFWFVRAAARAWTTSAQGRSLDLALAKAASVAVVLLLFHSTVDYALRSATLSVIFAFACALMLPALPGPETSSDTDELAGGARGARGGELGPRLRRLQGV